MSNTYLKLMDALKKLPQDYSCYFVDPYDNDSLAPVCSIVEMQECITSLSDVPEGLYAKTNGKPMTAKELADTIEVWAEEEVIKTGYNTECIIIIIQDPEYEGVPISKHIKVSDEHKAICFVPDYDDKSYQEAIGYPEEEED